MNNLVEEPLNKTIEIIVVPNLVDYNIEDEATRSFYVWPIIMPIFEKLEGESSAELNPRVALRTGKFPKAFYEIYVPTLDRNFLDEIKDYLFREYTTGKSLEKLNFQFPVEDIGMGYEAIVRGRRKDGKLFIQGEEVQQYLKAKRLLEEAKRLYARGRIDKSKVDRMEAIYKEKRKQFENMMQKFYGDEKELYDKVIEILENDRKAFDAWWDKHVKYKPSEILTKLWVKFAKKWFSTKDNLGITNFKNLSKPDGYFMRYQFVKQMYKYLMEITDELLKTIPEGRIKQEIRQLHNDSVRLATEKGLLVEHPLNPLTLVPIVFPKSGEGLQLLNDLMWSAFEYFIKEKASL